MACFVTAASTPPGKTGVRLLTGNGSAIPPIARLIDDGLCLIDEAGNDVIC